jgi:thiamine biosynthesis lipoprotein
MASLIPTKTSSIPWQSRRAEVQQEIMKTDILCEVLYSGTPDEEVDRALRLFFEKLRLFEKTYSRFRNDNDLWELNHSENMVVTQDFSLLIRCAQFFFRQTKGVFDPSVLSYLEKEGYQSQVYVAEHLGHESFADLSLNEITHEVTKPLHLSLDIGGFGKGYIVDQLALFLSKTFQHFLVDAGGDIYAFGQNVVLEYPYWAIEVENPAKQTAPLILMLTNMAVATSGITRRFWQKDGEEKHHLIDTATGKSATTELLSVTVIAPSTVSADVLAKTLFLLGKDAGIAFSEEHAIPALFLLPDGSIHRNSHIEPYVWQ